MFQYLSSRRFLTPLTTLSFIAVGLTGVSVFFHLEFGNLKEVHELAGLFFVLVGIGHLLVNFRAVLLYLKGGQFWVPLAMVGALALFLVFSEDREEGPSGRSLFEGIMTAPVTEIGHIFQLKDQETIARLAENGCPVKPGPYSLADISKDCHKNPRQILAIISKR